MELHWLTRLFVAQAPHTRDDHNAVFFTEILEIKRENGDLKDDLHILNHKFGMCLFPIRVDEVGPSNDQVASLVGTEPPRRPMYDAWCRISRILMLI